MARQEPDKGQQVFPENFFFMSGHSTNDCVSLVESFEVQDDPETFGYTLSQNENSGVLG